MADSRTEHRMMSFVLGGGGGVKKKKKGFRGIKLKLRLIKCGDLYVYVKALMDWLRSIVHVHVR